jgi:hypothetical protein
MFDEPPHTCPCDTTATEYLNSIFCGLLCAPRAIALQEGDLTEERQLIISGGYTGNDNDLLPSELLRLLFVSLNHS